MKFALIGYGKMGKAIEEVALHKGHSITLKIDENNLEDFTREKMAGTDVAIEFTGPHSAFDNISNTLDFGIPVICGSTGWTERMNEVEKLVREKNGAILYSSNFSIGVNIFF